MKRKAPQSEHPVKRVRREEAVIEAERASAVRRVSAQTKPPMPRPPVTALSSTLNPLIVIEKLINAQTARSDQASLVPRILKRLVISAYYGNATSSRSLADYIAKGALLKFYLPLTKGKHFINWLTGTVNNFVDTQPQSSTEVVFRRIISSLLRPDLPPPDYNRSFMLTAGYNLEITYWNSPGKEYSKVEACVERRRSPIMHGDNILQINYLRNIDDLQAVLGMSSSEYQYKMLYDRSLPRRLSHAEQAAKTLEKRQSSPLKQRLNASQLSDASSLPSQSLTQPSSQVGL